MMNDDPNAEALSMPIMSAVETMSGRCGLCIFSRRTDPKDFTSTAMMCCRFPPTAVPIFTAGKLTGVQGAFPPVQHNTPACGEYRPRLAQ